MFENQEKWYMSNAVAVARKQESGLILPGTNEILYVAARRAEKEN